jgi:hypothetical protein
MATKKHMMIQMTSKSIKAGKRLAQLSSWSCTYMYAAASWMEKMKL